MGSGVSLEMNLRIELHAALANTLKRARIRMGTDQYTLAAAVGLSRSMVKRLELGELFSVSQEDLQKVLQALTAVLQPSELEVPIRYMDETIPSCVLGDLLPTGPSEEEEEISPDREDLEEVVRDEEAVKRDQQPKQDPWDHIEEIHALLLGSKEGLSMDEIQAALHLSQGSSAKKGLVEILLRLGATCEGRWVLQPKKGGRISPEEKGQIDSQVRTFVRGRRGIMTSREVAQACKIKQDHARMILQKLVSEGALRAINIKRGSFYLRIEGSSV